MKRFTLLIILGFAVLIGTSIVFWYWRSPQLVESESNAIERERSTAPSQAALGQQDQNITYDVEALISLKPEEVIFDLLDLPYENRLAVGQAYVKRRLHPDNVYADNEYNRDRTINKQHSEAYLQIAPFLIELFRVGEPQLALEVYDVAENSSPISALLRELCDYLREEWTPESVLELLNSVDLAWQRGGRLAEEYLRIPPPGFAWKESMEWAAALPDDYLGYVLGKLYEQKGNTSNGLELLELLSAYPDDVNIDYALLPLSRVYKSDPDLVREVVDSMISETPIIFGEWYRTQHLLKGREYEIAFEWTLESRLAKTRKSESLRVFNAWKEHNEAEALSFLEHTQLVSEAEKLSYENSEPSEPKNKVIIRF